MEYNEIKEQIKQKLPVEKEFGDSDNLLELGLSSIVIMRLVNQWRKQGVKVAFGTLMEHPTLNEWWEIIQKSMKKKEKKAKAEKQERIPERDMRESFPLTDVQYAYWVGREDNQVLGGIGCHAYLEFDGNSVEAGRLEAAWNQLQYHHPMLRACFTEDGMQKIQERPFSEKLPVNDYSKMLEEEAYRKAEEVRERLSHRKLQIEKGEVAGVELTLLPSGKTRIHIDMDLLIADVQSLQILLKDLVATYNGEKLSEESKDWNFVAYLEKQATDDREEKEKAKDYWRKRLDTLPKGPELPLAKRPEEVKKTVFHRRIVRIAKKEWEALQSKAKEYQTTPAMLLLTVYATVLERWSRNKRFLINIPFFNRKTEYQGIEEVIADFTTLLLLEVDCENNPTFLELLGRIQKQLHEDMKYTAYSGVQVQRDLTKKYGDSSASAPVVFACNLGTPLVNERFKETLGIFSYMISQTPQVWNDFQSYEDEDGVQLTWDSVDALFPESMVEDMMKSFENLLHQLTEKSWNQRFDLLPESRREALEEMRRTGVPENPQCLHTAFLKCAEELPQKTALEDTGYGKTITYRELKEQAQAVAEHLVAEGIQKEPVAITLPRGYEQIVAALGILMSGNLYLPVSYNQPKERRKLIHEKTGVKYVITNGDWEKKITWPEGTRRLILEEMRECVSEVELPKIMPEDSAYIIMTSGSTGIPKGVEITHASAWNTIDDINKKYRVSKDDAALAVSAMDFDLSVYDLFGVLGTGGTLVLLPEEEKRNADYWLEQVKKYNITIWNSVPVLLDMLLVRAEAMKEQIPLRVVMLSGDWIGLDLPERVAELTQTCEFIAMGGATEASIWSNYQNVSLPLPENWKSIPYGHPLKHQAYRVVDEFGRDCPYWVEGELWIGGYGVAKGYRGDKELTEKKFVTDETGRWYRTGDLGRFWQDETIEFLGRQDQQVKIRGHRIELGEIEHAIQGFPGVGKVVVDTFSDGHGNKSLAAYIEAEKKENSGVTDWKYGDSFLDSAWKKMKESVSDWMTLSDAEKNAQYETFLAYADQKCLHLMLTELERIGLLSRQTNGGFAVVPAAENKIVAEQKVTVSRWLEILKKESILQKGLKEINIEVKTFGLPEAVEAVDIYFEKLQPYLEAMLIGKEKPLEVFYQKEADLAPNRLLSRIPGHSETIRELTEILEKLEEVPHNVPLQILEIGTRDADITKEILHALEGGTVAYTYADSSKYFLEEARRELSEFEEIEFEQFSLDDSLDRQEIIEKILHDSETEIILTQQGAENQMSWLKKWKTLPVCGRKAGETVQQEKNAPEDLAYVIYTSGTTGMPKGVMISHRNAVNTILDVNNRYQITENDTAFGISNLHFDLSVYDIFGMLGVGGTIVIPDPERVKDPEHWVEVLNTEKVTVWNSVPAFVEMLAEYEEYQKKLHTKTLRLILMSGDWIPVSLPGRIRNILGDIKIVALGGATEASIWSNCFEVPEQIQEKWKSIPYGKPLANQRYYILDQNMENCPDWVAGDLYIAGTGVAQGYLNDEERTKEKFIIWETTGERLYSTGDMGRYWEDGNIEFLGRVDNQVKIAGYRVELGEIETILQTVTGIKSAIVVKKKLHNVDTMIAFYIEDEKNQTDSDKITMYLSQYLPKYMIPSVFIKVTEFPLGVNGKVDRILLADQKIPEQSNKQMSVEGMTELEEKILNVWKEILVQEINLDSDFFAAGGNSLQAVKLTNRLSEVFSKEVTIGELFENPSVRKMARLLGENNE